MLPGDGEEGSRMIQAIKSFPAYVYCVSVVFIHKRLKLKKYCSIACVFTQFS